MSGVVPYGVPYGVGPAPEYVVDTGYYYLWTEPISGNRMRWDSTAVEITRNSQGQNVQGRWILMA